MKIKIFYPSGNILNVEGEWMGPGVVGDQCGIFMAVCGWFIERDEHAIVMGLHLLPMWYGDFPDHLAEHEDVAETMDELHRRKIDLSDEIFVVNWDDYIGQSTKGEIEYAINLGKPIRWLSHDVIGDTVRAFISQRTSALKLKQEMPK